MKSATTKLIAAMSLVFISATSQAQSREFERNSIGWYSTMVNVKIAPKWSIHAEYQWRRVNLITHWQQSLARVGINRKLGKHVQLRVGYGLIHTFSYGKMPLNAQGFDFNEHRLFEALIHTDTLGKFTLTHRLMLEQRWTQRFWFNAPSTGPLEFGRVYTHRARYMVRWQYQAPTKGKFDPFFAVYDEVFVGFGKNVGQNTFDQNRFAVVAGLARKKIRLEAGFLNQRLQLGYRVNNVNYFQNNLGLVTTVYLNL